MKTVEDDPRYDKKKAEYLLKSFVELHPHAIGEKVRVCVEHFAAQVQGEIGGKAKAMIVTRSRLHAVRCKLAVDRYLAYRQGDQTGAPAPPQGLSETPGHSTQAQGAGYRIGSQHRGNPLVIMASARDPSPAIATSW